MLAFHSWLFFLFWIPSLVLSSPACRCLFGNPDCWPKDSDFSALASQVSQPLLYPRPPESACYSISDPSGDCSVVQTNVLNATWRSDQPGASQFPNYQTYIFDNGTISACYLNTNLGYPCTQGSVPNIGVDARLKEDVIAAVKFAARHNLRVAIKSTGHDFLGRSTARGSFLLWMHHLKNITYDAAFVPDGAPTTVTYKAMTLGAGVQWYEAYAAAHSHGRFLVGGISAGGTVGAAGGWIMGGGHSAFSARHGLGVDNAFQFTVVTADGSCLVANAYQNQDMFWALRGGGGGTFGVVVSVTYLTHDIFPLALFAFTANFTNPAIARKVTSSWVKIHPALADNHWGGYSFLSEESLQFFYVAPNVSKSVAESTIQPFLSDARTMIPDLQTQSTSFDSFYAFFVALFSTGSQVGSASELGSRLIPRNQMENNPSEVAEAMLSIRGGMTMNFVSGGAVSKVNPESTGLNPAWRTSLGVVEFGESWPEGSTSSQILEARKRIIENIQIIDKVAGPASATYFNEASLYEADFKKTFFGPHYSKLKSIKDKYDPQGLFIVAEGVGSEEWDKELNCRL